MTTGVRGSLGRGLGQPLLVAALALCSPDAPALELPELQYLLQARSPDSLQFEEERSSPWLSQTVRSSGRLRRVGEVLEKRVERPEPATWRLLPDRMIWIAADGRSQRSVAYADSASAGALALTLRQLVAGELTRIADRFVPTLGGDATNWTLRLEPREPALARAIEYIEVAGRQGVLDRIELGERSGAVTTTHLHLAPPDRSSDVRP